MAGGKAKEKGKIKGKQRTKGRVFPLLIFLFNSPITTSFLLSEESVVFIFQVKRIERKRKEVL